MAIISDIVTELRNIKTSITTALSNKGVTSSGQWENFGNEINSISSGIKPYKLNVINNYSTKQNYSCNFRVNSDCYTQSGTTLTISDGYTADVTVKPNAGYQVKQEVYSINFTQSNPIQTLTLPEPSPLNRQGLPVLQSGNKIDSNSINVYWLKDQYIQQGASIGGGIRTTAYGTIQLESLNTGSQTTYKTGGTIYFNTNKALVLNITPIKYDNEYSAYNLVVTIIDINNKQLGAPINVPLNSNEPTDINLPVGARGITLANAHPDTLNWNFFINVS